MVRRWEAIVLCVFLIIVLVIVLHGNIDKTLVNSLHGLLNCEIGGLDCLFITTEYISRVHCIHMQHLFCNTLLRSIYSVVNIRITILTVGDAEI